MICAYRECRTEFKRKRKHQKYCSRGCRYADHNRLGKPMRLKPEEDRRIRTMRQRAEKRVTRFMAKKPPESATLPRLMPQEQNLAFSKSAPAGNIKGALSRVALLNPRLMMRLAASIREDAASGRPNCRTCEFACADGAECARSSEF